MTSSSPDFKTDWIHSLISKSGGTSQKKGAAVDVILRHTLFWPKSVKSNLAIQVEKYNFQLLHGKLQSLFRGFALESLTSSCREAGDQAFKMIISINIKGRGNGGLIWCDFVPICLCTIALALTVPCYVIENDTQNSQ